MFNPNRFVKLTQWTVQRSPFWYLFVHFAACVVIASFIFFVVEDASDLLGGGSAFFDPIQLFNGFLFANALSMIPVAAHFVGRHFKDARQSTDFLTLPVSRAERYSVLGLGSLVVFPLIALVSSFAFYFLLKLIGGDAIPKFAWAWRYIVYALVGYLALIPFYFALAFLRPRNTVLWGIGVSIVTSIFLALLTYVFYETPDFTFYLHDLAANGRPDNFFGPSIDGVETIGLSGFNGLVSRVPVLICIAAVVVVLLLTSAWSALKNQEV